MNNECNLRYFGMSCEEFGDTIVKINIGGLCISTLLFLLRILTIIKWSFIIVFIPVLLPSFLLFIGFIFAPKCYAIALSEHMSESMKDK